MLCNVILTYMLLFTDGHSENHTKWIDTDTIPVFKELFKGNTVSQVDPTIKAVKNIKYTIVPYSIAKKVPKNNPLAQW